MARVIARPFTGAAGRVRADQGPARLLPGAAGSDSTSICCTTAGVPVLALGKISEIFAGRGVTTQIKVASNDENLALVQELLRRRSDRGRFDEGLLFTNLVDFDMVWGHRNDVDGFAAGLAAVDAALPDIIARWTRTTLLIVTADHGVDPTTVSTDHSREYVPLLLYPRPAGVPGGGLRGHLADTGATCIATLTGESAGAGGRRRSTALRPSRGWRPYTPALACPGRPGADCCPARVGPAEAAEAAAWLRRALGDASRGRGRPGLRASAGRSEADAGVLEVPLSATIPFWRERGRCPGIRYRLAAGRAGGPARSPCSEGGLHGYEGFDLSELQLPVRTLARWGVQKVLLTSSCGAVAAPSARPETW